MSRYVFILLPNPTENSENIKIFGLKSFHLKSLKEIFPLLLVAPLLFWENLLPLWFYSLYMWSVACLLSFSKSLSWFSFLPFFLEDKNLCLSLVVKIQWWMSWFWSFYFFFHLLVLDWLLRVCLQPGDKCLQFWMLFLYYFMDSFFFFPPFLFFLDFLLRKYFIFSTSFLFIYFPFLYLFDIFSGEISLSLSVTFY